MVLNHRRSEMDILSDLLSVSEHGVKKTRLMYTVNMSYSQFTKYLEFLLERGLVEEKNSKLNNGSFILLTDKGKKILTAFNNIYKCLEM